MRFSFIIPALNEEKLISPCIKSIKKQTKPTDEIIVVDNGSEDKTAAIANRLGCRVVKEKKKGLSNARNQGAKLAKGEVLCFVDADGIVSKNWLKAASQSFLTNKTVEAVSGLNIFQHQLLSKKLWFNTYTFIVFLGVFILDKLFKKTALVGNNLAIKKELFWALGGFEPILGEDIWMTRKFWQLKERKGYWNPSLVIWYSPRRFESTGFLKTIFYWVWSLLRSTSQDDYYYQSKN